MMPHSPQVKSLLLFVFSAVLSLTVFAQKAPVSQGIKHYNTGLDFAEQGNCRRAIPAFKKAMEVSWSAASACQSLRDTLCRNAEMNLYIDAVLELKKCIASEGYYQQGFMLDSSISFLTREINRINEVYPRRYFLGDLYYELAYDLSSFNPQHNKNFTVQEAAQMSQRNFVTAISEYERFRLTTDQRYIDCLEELAMVAYNQGGYETAKDYAYKAVSTLEKNGDSESRLPSFQIWLAKCYFRLNDKPKVYSTIKKGLSLAASDNNATAYNTAIRYYACFAFNDGGAQESALVFKTLIPGFLNFEKTDREAFNFLVPNLLENVVDFCRWNPEFADSLTTEVNSLFSKLNEVITNNQGNAMHPFQLSYTQAIWAIIKNDYQLAEAKLKRCDNILNELSMGVNAASLEGDRQVVLISRIRLLLLQRKTTEAQALMKNLVAVIPDDAQRLGLSNLPNANPLPANAMDLIEDAEYALFGVFCKE
jgi:hypothetical protein